MKEELDAVYKAFESYIRSNTYFDILYSEKFGYIWVVEANTANAEAESLGTPRKMLDAIFTEMINDVTFSPDIPFSPNAPSEDPYRFLLTESDETQIRRNAAEILKAVEKTDRDAYLRLLDSYLKAHQEDRIQAWVDGNEIA